MLKRSGKCFFTIPISVLTLVSLSIRAAQAQGLTPLTPAQEYIYLSGHVVAVEENPSSSSGSGGTNTDGSSTIALNGYYNLDGISNDANPSNGNIDGSGNSLSSSQVPASISVDGATYTTGPTTDGALNVIKAVGRLCPYHRRLTDLFHFSVLQPTAHKPAHFR